MQIDKNWALRISINVVIWLVAFFAASAIAVMLEKSVYIDFAVILFASLVLIVTRLKAQNVIVVECIALLLIVLLYALTANRDFSYALGYALGGGLLGLIFYKIIFKKQSEKQTGFRNYVIGVTLFAIIGVPMFVSSAKHDVERKQKEEEIGFAAGTIIGVCEMRSYLIATYCPSAKLNERVSRTCNTKNVIEGLDVDDSVKKQLRNFIETEEYKTSTQYVRKQTDIAFELQPDTALACATMSEYINKNFDSAYDKIESK